MTVNFKRLIKKPVMDYEHRKKKKQGKTQWQFGMCPIYPRKVLQL